VTENNTCVAIKVCTKEYLNILYNKKDISRIFSKQNLILMAEPSFPVV
jgi:hypothetical protein